MNGGVRDMNSDQLVAALLRTNGEAALEAARRLDSIATYINSRALLVSAMLPVKVHPRDLRVEARRIIDLIDGQDVDPEEEDR